MTDAEVTVIPFPADPEGEGASNHRRSTGDNRVVSTLRMKWRFCFEKFRSK